MKKYILILILSISVFQLKAQYPVQVGTPESGGVILPYDNQYDYNWCTTIYPQDEINAHGNIVKVFLDVSSITPGLDVANNQKIFMALTTDVEFTDAGYPDTLTMTKIFDGTINYFTPGGPEDPDEIILTTPFAYNNTDNLIIHYENRDGIKVSTLQEAQINFSDNSSSLNICKYKSQDVSFPNTSGTLSNKMPIVYLGFDSGLDVGVSKLNDKKDFLLPGIHDLSINFRNYSGDTITSVDINWELNGILQTSIPWTGTLYTGQESTNINLLSNYDFSPNDYTIKAWTSNPNAGVDELAENDTITKIIKVANYIEIGHYNNSTSAMPYSSYSYGWSSSIYELDSMQAGRIYGLEYNVEYKGHAETDQYIYLTETTESIISSANYPDVGLMNLVFEGNIDFSENGWQKILFDSSFVLNENLILHYQKRSGTYYSPGDATTFASSAYKAQTSVYLVDNTSFPETAGWFSSYAPMIRFYFALPNDAGIVNLDAPDRYFNTGNNNILVTLKNYGTDNLTSANIKYRVDNGTIQTFNWTGDLPCYKTEQNIIIGNENFTYGEHTIKIWTDTPNGYNDYQNENDTLLKTLYATNPLCGNYVIGEAPSDYLTVKEAVDTLNSAGVSCDVVFDIKPRTYNDQYIINEINDAGQNSTVTFQSQTGDSTDVVLTTDSTDYIFNLNSADYLRFKRLTFTSDSAEKFMVLDSGACNNIFENNQFVDGVYQIFNTETTIADTNNLIASNLFLNGGSVICFNSKNTAYETNNVVHSNVFKNQSGNSIEISYQENLIITENSFETNKSALYCGAMKNSSITKNKIKTEWSAIELLGYSDPNLVANNFIICKSNEFAGYSIRIGNSNLKFYNNTIKTIGEQNQNTILMVWGNNNDFKNNILVNLKAGPTITIGSGYTGNLSDYNCLYTNGESIANWQNTNCSGLTEWQVASGQDLNSISILPGFVSETDLHTNSLVLDGAGTPLPEINDDIDGEPRDAVNPDIGADEFTSTCSGALSGTYTIGASGNYLTFKDAITALRNCGVNGSVIFNIKDGTYNEQVLLTGTTPGITENDTITFQSQSGDSTSVILTYKADTLNNYTLKLNGADRFVFKQITIHAEDTTYSRVIEIGNGACNNLIQNCIINGIVSSDDNNNQALVYFTEDNTYRDTSNIIKGNMFLNGSYGIYLTGNSNNKETFNTISGNYFTGQSAYGIYANYQKNLIIEKNIVENNYQLDIDYYGINIYYNTDSTIIRNNIINIERDYYSYGLYMSGSDNFIFNNFISLKSNTYHSNGIYGLGNDSKCYYNSVNIYGSSSPVAINVTYNTTNAQIKNNIFANHAGGYALKCWYGGSQILSADFNNLYSNGGYIADWLDVDIVDLSEWQTASGFGSNSISSNPNFVSNTDLHTSNILFNEAATPVSEVTDDIDGELRDATNPDIGADEFTSATFSLGDDATVCVDAEYKIDAGVGFDTYMWSTGADSSYILVDSTGIGYGSKEYFVTVTLDGNSYNDSITVTFSSPIAMSQDYFCADASTDSVLLIAGDGAEYNWSTGETTQSIWLSATYVYVTVTDANGCQGTEYINRQWNSCPANFTMPDDTTICNNDSIVIDANSACSADYANHSYLWNTGDTTETITVYPDDITSEYNEYSVEIIYSSSGRVCVTSDTVNVYKNVCPANLGMPADTTIYIGETLVLDANSTSCSADYDNYSYLWSTDETTETITVNATTLGVGSYTYSVSVTNNSTTSNCITTDVINVTVSTTIDVESLAKKGISIYPNPTDGIIKLEFSNTIENTWIRIINVTGQVVYSEYLENLSGIKTLDLSELNKGVYIISIENKNTNITQKITLY